MTIQKDTNPEPCQLIKEQVNEALNGSMLFDNKINSLPKILAYGDQQNLAAIILNKFNNKRVCRALKTSLHSKTKHNNYASMKKLNKQQLRTKPSQE